MMMMIDDNDDDDDDDNSYYLIKVSLFSQWLIIEASTFLIKLNQINTLVFGESGKPENKQ